MRELVEFIARSLVRHPESVEVREVTRDSVLILEIRVDPRDTGLLIGKQGRVVRAIRTVARSAAARRGQRVVVEVV